MGAGTIELEITYGDSTGILTFREPLANAPVKHEGKATKDILQEELISVSGLKDVQGNEITKEQVIEGEVPARLYAAVSHGYIAALTRIFSAEAAAKNFKVRD